MDHSLVAFIHILFHVVIFVTVHGHRATRRRDQNNRQQQNVLPGKHN